MANYNGTITFNSVTLDVISASPKKTQKTRKVIIGKTLSEVNVIGLDAQQWVITITGIITGTSQSDLATKRANIEALDDVASHAYVDGIHNGNYIMKPGTLTFNDSGDRGNISYEYTFELVEE